MSRTLYFERADIAALIPAAFILQALDDDGDGVEDTGLYDVVAANACNDVDALLSPMFTVPFAAPLPALVTQAAKAVMAASLYQRRGIEGAKNPYAKSAADKCAQLTRIVQKQEPVPKDFPVAVQSVSAITEPAKTCPSDGGLLA